MLRYGFFDSEITGFDEEDMPIFDRAESSDFLAVFISRIISDGVLALPGDCFQVVAYEGMKVKVRPGFGIVRGRFAMDMEESEFDIGEAHKTYRRIDRIILRANYLERLCEIIVRAGEPGAKPVPPEMIRPASGDYYELCLATVTVNAKQGIITQANITDTRYDSRVCGVVTQLIDHLDTSVFFAQLDKFYEEFVDKSNTSYEQFRQMAQEAYRGFSEDITGYIDRLKKDSSDAYEKYNADIASYISRLTEKGNADLAEITQQMLDFRNRNEAEFTEWFERIRGLLDIDAAGELLNITDSLAARLDDTEEMLLSGRVAAKIYTEDGHYITDDTGTPVLGDWPICQCGNGKEVLL